MTITNVTIKEQNLDLLKVIQNTHTKANKEYLGFNAPCVVFEDTDILVSATNIEEYNLYIYKTSSEILDLLKLAKIKLAGQKFSDFKKEKESKYTQDEVDTFITQQAEAIEYLKDNTAPTPILSMMSGGNETLRLGLIQAVLANIQEVAVAQGEMVLKRDAIKACTTQAELDAIVV